MSVCPYDIQLLVFRLNHFVSWRTCLLYMIGQVV
jgi:hypothetical protein